MMEPPGSAWRDDPWTPDEARGAAPLKLDWTPLPGIVRHVFTHFELELAVYAGKAPRFAPVHDGVWATPDRFGEYALPSVMKKVARHAIKKTS